MVNFCWRFNRKWYTLEVRLKKELAMRDERPDL